MTDDLVSRLRMLIDVAGRDASPVGKAVTVFAPILTEATDEIECLRAAHDENTAAAAAEIERLQAIVVDLASENTSRVPWDLAKLIIRARQALQGDTMTATARWVEDLFPVEDPCPWCGHRRVFGFLLRDAAGKHQHTRYGCAAWPLCAWVGWTVPIDAPGETPS